MPIFRSISAFEVARGIKAFLNLEAGLTRGKVPEPGGSEQLRIQTQKLNQTQRQLEQRRRQLENKDNKIARLEKQLGTPKNGGINPENIIWILGTGRTGSTWLAKMMRNLENHVVWEEPRVGEVFGEYMDRHGPRTATKANILSSHYRNAWLGSIRSFVLDGAAERFPQMGGEQYLVIKEPNGSIGAPLLMEALPESRMIFLIRDPRDVCASVLDGAKKGNWLYMIPQEGDYPRGEDGPLSPADTDPDSFVQGRAAHYLRDIGNTKRAYEAHRGRKVMVKYEDLRVDTLGTMKSMYSTLDVPVDKDELARVVDKHSWENVPEEMKGEGKFIRKATPGAWKEDLTPGQTEIVEKINAPLLEEFYPGNSKTSFRQ
jgi:hypothetical protein